MSDHYDVEFFDNVTGSAGKSASPFLASVVHVALDGTPPTSVLDVGCGPGVWLAEWRRMGVQDVVGVDGDYVPTEALAIPASAFRPIDISQPFDLQQRFDLVECLEVAEHVPQAHSETLVDNLCRHGDLIMFSAAIPGQGGRFHVNEQPYEYWRAKFGARGYAVYDSARRPVIGLKEIEPWYRFNTFLFANEVGRQRLSHIARREIVEASRPLEILAPWQWSLRCSVRSRLRPILSKVAKDI
ncbi:MAG: methyltransferase domain-containing protein [Mycobacterium sp.]